MSIKADKWIRRMAEGHRMIEPFEAGQVREVNGHRIVSYGTSSYGYDVRCSDEFKIFTNINSTIVDPKAFDAGSFVDFKGSVCIIPPNSFALARTVEYFRIPRNVLVACLGKSTYARCFRGDTRVALVDGTSPTLEDMARRADAGELFWGYSVGAYGRICVSLLDAPRYVGRDSLLEIELDNGEVIAATPDHDFMQRELEDVRAARRDLLELIAQVDREITETFTTAYRDVAMQFERLVAELFPGGEGRLVLTDPASPLESGIEIEASPGRKRVKRISLLSGGERSLTALAVLFAIFTARPSPFYLMDEVEPALDDVNLHRFLRLVDGFAKDAQVLIVTHQKRTMEIAGMLYGISLNTDGTTKVVAQRMEPSASTEAPAVPMPQAQPVR